MRAEHDSWLNQPLLADRPAAANRGWRVALLLAWVVATGWLAWHHVPWRDEVRAWSLMLQARDLTDLFRVVQGEGHPYLWYVLLRVGHELFGVREVLPALGLAIGFAAAALLALKAPFRLAVIAILLFSLHLGFNYSVIARNYGISALVMFLIALAWPKVKKNLWLGLLLLLLCNTNAPSVLLAGALLLYRMVELAEERPGWRSRQVAVVLVNGVLLLIGALLCLVAIYPPVNDAPAVVSRVAITPVSVLNGLVSVDRSFGVIGFDSFLPATNIFIVLSLLVFVRSRPAIVAAGTAFVALQLFFSLVFAGGYRHAALYLIFLVTLLWIEGVRRWRGELPAEGRRGLLPLAANWALLVLLAMQTILYVKGPLISTALGRPWSEAARLAAILDRPEFRGSIVMFDPDAMGEALVYHTQQPYWLLRQDRLGRITPFTMTGNKELSLDAILATAQRLQSKTGRPVLIALQRDPAITPPGRYDVMYADYTLYTRENIARFKAGTRQVADLRGAYGDENYTVYRYPR